jgi:hypothetical protein
MMHTTREETNSHNIFERRYCLQLNVKHVGPHFCFTAWRSSFFSKVAILWSKLHTKFWFPTYREYCNNPTITKIEWWKMIRKVPLFTKWFKYDRDDLCVNKSQFVAVIFEPPCTISTLRIAYTCCTTRSCSILRQVEIIHRFTNKSRYALGFAVHSLWARWRYILNE